MSEQAGLWIRVSSGGQDEELQIPDVMQWVNSHRYEAAETYTVHGKSGYKVNKGFDRMWEQVLADLRIRKITVLVVWKQDRLDRKLNTFQMLKQVVDAGGRVEFVTQPHLNDLTTMGGRIALKVQEEIAYAESKDKSDRIHIVLGDIQRSGSLSNKPPWGYTSEGSKRRKTMVPTDDGRKLVPEVFARCIAGESVAMIARWLEQETGKPWWGRTVGAMLRNSAYMGHYTDLKGVTIHRCEPLVDADVFRRAGEALAARPKRGHIDPAKRAMLSGVIFCPRCENSPMYRLASGYYRCAGRGRNRKGCGNMVKVSSVDEAVTGIMTGKVFGGAPIMVQKVIPGHDHHAAIEGVRFEMRQLPALDLDDDEFDRRMGELRAERDRLRSLPAVPDQVEWVETGETYGSAYDALETSERGPWLASKYITVTASKTQVTVTLNIGNKYPVHAVRSI